MIKDYKYKPLGFFLAVMLLTWSLWFIAAYLSYQEGQEGLQYILLLLGLFIPAIVAIFLIFSSKNPQLKADFKTRLFRLDGLNTSTLAVLFLVLPLSALVSILLSLLIGESPDQLEVFIINAIMSGEFLFSLIIFVLASTTEEVGWRGYGVDSLRSRFNLFTTSAVFALLWGLWHLPLFVVKEYYHNTLLETDILFALNFFLSIIPLTFIMNWLFYKCNRSISIAILFHFLTVISAEIFMISDISKCIQTLVLLVPAIFLVWWDKELFFGDIKTFSK
ncbi:MAG: CPBP family glutamic-type intramembrane protease [Candidatus Hodarchaeales archaeon]|jgi:membrane protease YdiL (CAAX protease family)